MKTTVPKGAKGSNPLPSLTNTNNGDMDMDFRKTTEIARLFAEKKHKGQLYGKDPYTKHLSDAAKIAREFELGEFIETAVWLHDTLEDTDTKLIDLISHFSTEIAQVVMAVTDVPADKRDRRAKKTLPKIYDAGATAVAVKLCDRIANVEASAKVPHKLKMYKKEQDFFKQSLYRVEDKLDPLWDRLENAISKGC